MQEFPADLTNVFLQVYFFIMEKKIVGCLIAEAIKQASFAIGFLVFDGLLVFTVLKTPCLYTFRHFK